MNRILLFAILFFSFTALSQPLWMRYPSISPNGDKIAFSYQGDLFVVDSEGGNALQITSHNAHDFSPIWSNDGNEIAFASDRYGNYDVFSISATGGEPKRLTFHSANDIPQDYTRDGKQLIYTSSRLDSPKSVQFPYGRLHEVYVVSTQGGIERQYATIAAEDMQFSADGNSILFHNKKGYEDDWRKHHTSSITRDIVLYDIKNDSYQQITNWQGEDRNPIWAEGTSFYFLSEKSGSFNVWKGDLKNPYTEQVTNFKNHPVRFLSRANNGTLCFGYDGEIYTYTNGKANKVNISIQKDRTKNPLQLKKVGGASEFAISPNGKEMAFIFRGEVFVTSLDYATTKQITNTAEQERNVSFSPDGKKILYAGERNESWNIYEVEHGREGEKYFYNATLLNEKAVVETNQETFQPAYSPDGKEIAFLENRTTLKVLNLESNKTRLILDGNYNYSYSDGDQYYTWAPDSKWLAVQYFDNGRWSTDIGLVNASGKEKPINLTKSGYGNGMPKFAMNGEMVYYSTDKNGMRSHGSWGSQNDVEAVFLTEEAYQKFKLNKEDFELWKEEQEEVEKDTTKTDKKAAKETEDEVVSPIKIELEGLMDRKMRLTIHASDLIDFLVSNEGDQLYYLTRFEDKFNIWTTKFKEGETSLLSKTENYGSELIFDKEEKHLFARTQSGIAKIDVSDGTLKPIAYAAEMMHDAASERTYMFNHAWRQVREKFYVKDLHGVDWDMYKKEYAKFLPYINNGTDFAEMLSELLGEINASHTGARYRNYSPNGDQTASLGCYYDNAYSDKGIKIIEIMDKSPLDTKSDKIVANVIIEKIDGQEILKDANYLPLLNRKEGKKVLISFYNPKTNDRWDEVITPISRYQESELAYERWVKNCEKTVDELSKGELGYVHIKGMNSESFRVLFDRALGELYQKKALIIDTRFNGGGWLHDDLATFLSGKMYMSFEPRGQKNMGGEPIWKWQKPSCVLMSEGNYSDAHLFPYTYKALGIGKLIGMPVPGTGTAVWWEQMIDGKTVFGIPQIGMRSTTEGFLVENHDLLPDIQVDNTYRKFINGEDEQLKAAVLELMK